MSEAYGAGVQSFAEDVHTNQQFAGDDGLHVRFFIKAKQNMDRSEREGRPIFEDTEYVEIMTPGGKESIICRPVRDTDRMRFAKRYQRFKDNAEQIVDGTPLAHVTFLTPSQIAELHAAGVQTVEQLADMADSNASVLMGFQRYKALAKQFLDVANTTVNAGAMQEELAARDEMIAKMQAQLDALTASSPQPVDEVVEEIEETTEAPEPKASGFQPLQDD